MVTWRTTWTGAAEQAAGRAAAMRAEGYQQMPLSTKITGMVMLVVIVLILIALVAIGLLIAIPLILIGVVVGSVKRLMGGFSRPSMASEGRRNVKVIERRE